LNKFLRFLGKISAETCQKIDYFGRKSQKSPSAALRAPHPDPRLDSKLENVQRLYSPIESLVKADAWQFWGKTKLIFLFSAPLPGQKSFLCHWGGWYLSMLL